MVSKEELNKIEEGIDKDIRELLSVPKKTTAIILVSSVFIASIITLNGINPDLARVLAGSIITAGGLLLGFFILGATSFSNKDFVEGVHETLIIKHVDIFLKKAETFRATSESEVRNFIDSEFRLAISRTGFSEGVMRGTFYTSVVFLLISIGCAFCLFGVDKAYVFPSWQNELFTVILYFSIVTLFVSANGLLKNIFSLLDRSTEAYTRGTYDLVMKIFDEKIKEQEQKKHKQKILFE